jgi:hypothetical protein
MLGHFERRQERTTGLRERKLLKVELRRFPQILECFFNAFALY